MHKFLVKYLDSAANGYRACLRVKQVLAEIDLAITAPVTGQHPVYRRILPRKARCIDGPLPAHTQSIDQLERYSASAITDRLCVQQQEGSSERY